MSSQKSNLGYNKYDLQANKISKAFVTFFDGLKI
jgi:hypothetical protein